MNLKESGNADVRILLLVFVVMAEQHRQSGYLIEIRTGTYKGKK